MRVIALEAYIIRFSVADFLAADSLLSIVHDLILKDDPITAALISREWLQLLKLDILNPSKIERSLLDNLLAVTFIRRH